MEALKPSTFTKYIILNIICGVVLNSVYCAKYD